MRARETPTLAGARAAMAGEAAGECILLIYSAFEPPKRVSV